MGASGSRQTNGKQGKAKSDQFVLIITAPPGVGKEDLMGVFITENVDRMAYIARIGSVRATQPGLLYFYESFSDVAVEPSADNSYSTILQAMQAALQDGKSVVVDVDSAGARALRQSNVPGCYVFLLPESMDAVRQNIQKSMKGDPKDAIERTVKAAEKEIQSVDEAELYDYGVQNDDNAGAIEQIAELAEQHGLVAPAVMSLESHQQYPRTPVFQYQSQEGSGRAALVKPPLKGTPAASLASPSASSLSKSSKVVGLGSNATSARQNDADELVIPEQMSRWKGEVAVVTGVTSPVGWAVCEALLAAGMRVVGAGPRKDRLQALQTAILDHGIAGDSFLPVMCDIAREDEVRALMAITVKTFKGQAVAVLVAAGEGPPAEGGVLEGKAAAWGAGFGGSVVATGMCCREACESMKRAKQWGHIVIVREAPGSADRRGAIHGATQASLAGLAAGLREEARDARVPLKVSLLTASNLPAAEPITGRAASTAPPPPPKDGEAAPKAVAGAVLSVLTHPPNLDISEVTVKPTEQFA